MQFTHILYRGPNDEEEIEVTVEVGGERADFSNGFSGELIVEVTEPADFVPTKEENKELRAEAQRLLR